MQYKALQARRRAAGICGALILCLALAFAVDGMIAGGRTDPKQFHLLPGQTLQLSDLLPRGAQALGDLTLAPSDTALAPRFIETFSGFWLGGTLWRADVDVPANLAPGDYVVDLRYQNGTQPAPPQTFRIHVAKDAATLQAASLSITTRATGLSPYVLAAMLLPLALVPMGASYAFSRRIALVLAQERTAEIYRSMASPEGQRIFFTLPGYALAVDSLVDVLSERDLTFIGKARVLAVRGPNAEAVMLDGGYVRPGALARPDEGHSISG